MYASKRQAHCCTTLQTITYPKLNNNTQFQSVKAIHFEDMMIFVCGELMPPVANLCPQAVSYLQLRDRGLVITYYQRPHLFI